MMKLFANNGRVDSPNYYNLPKGAVVYFQDGNLSDCSIEDFISKAGLSCKPSQLFEHYFKVIDTISFEGNNRYAYELRGEVFWVGWADCYLPIEL